MVKEVEIAKNIDKEKDIESSTHESKSYILDPPRPSEKFSKKTSQLEKKHKKNTKDITTQPTKIGIE